MSKFTNYIRKVRASGHHAFTTEQAMSDLDISAGAVHAAAFRLKKKGELISPAKQLYVIVPPEYHMLGCLPAEELVPILMEHWRIPYYVCLLSAAAYHGASHQKPQIFQVMTEKQMKPILCSQVKIEFIYKKSLQDLPTTLKTVGTGYLTVSSAELTAMDLLTYPTRCGGLNHTATVLSELLEAIDPKALLALMQQSKETAWIQRLGLILERIDSMDEIRQNTLIKVIKNYLDTMHPSPTLLAPNLPRNGRKPHAKWAVIENTTIESDL